LSKHISRNERWKKAGNNIEEYTSDLGLVVKDRSDGSQTWMGLVKEGFGLRICGRGFKRARNAMIAVEEAAERMKRFGSPLPPIQFPAHIF
jgi:hypothetical protein